MKTTLIKPQIVLLEFHSRKELTLTMCRVQEFYESAHEHIRDQYFCWETFLETFTKDDGVLDYFSYWSGFNIPSTAFCRFFTLFSSKQDLTTREQKLFDEVNALVDVGGPFYVIAALAGEADTIDHELAHALFHINPVYRLLVTERVQLICSVVRDHMCSVMHQLGYAEQVFDDEINAYLATSDEEYLSTRFVGLDLQLAREPIDQLKGLFNRYSKLACAV